MRVNATQILDGIERYIEGEILAKIPDARKWVVGGYVALLMRPFRQNPDAMFRHPLIAPLEHLVTPDGTVDLDTVRDVFREQAQKYPSFLNIPMVGPYHMDVNDIDKIYNYIIS